MALQKQDNYKYDSLEYDKDCIRLLDLLPGKQNDKIQCRFRNQQLSDAVSFTAISYVCGRADTSSWVELEDGRVAVRPNVVELLATIRDENEVQTIWIDAVNIDATNVKERNHQVQLMSKIYRAAKSVLVWLGPEFEECSTLFSLINCSSGRMEACEIVEYIQSLNQTDQDRLWKALGHICTQDYWGRMWIVQEVLLAKQLILRCGHAVADGTFFLNFLYEFVSANSANTSFRYLQNIIISCFAYKLLKRWQGQHGKPNGTLQDLIEEYGESACADARDKVYALLGLAEDHQGNKTITVDYEQPLTTLFLLVMAFAQPHSPMAFGHSLLRILDIEPPKLTSWTSTGRSISYPFKIEARISLKYIEEEMWGSLPTFFFSIGKTAREKAISHRLIQKDCGCIERHTLEHDFEDIPAGYSCVYAFAPRTVDMAIIHRAQLVIGRMPDSTTFLVFIVIRWEDKDINGSNSQGIQTHSRCIARICPKNTANLDQLSFHSAGEFLDCTIEDPGILIPNPVPSSDRTYTRAKVTMSPLLIMRLMTFG